MRIFSSIREFFWTLLEPIEENNLKQITQLAVSDDNLQKIVEIAIKDYQSEEDRNKAIGTKSSLFIGTLGVITSIVLGVRQLC